MTFKLSLIIILFQHSIKVRLRSYGVLLQHKHHEYFKASLSTHQIWFTFSRALLLLTENEEGVLQRVAALSRHESLGGLLRQQNAVPHQTDL